MGQKSLVPRRLGKLPFHQAHHKHSVGLRQAHAARRGQDHAVQALGNMAHIGGAQQQRKEFRVVRRGQRFLPQQLGQLVEQPHDHIPFPQHLVRLRHTALGTQRFRQSIQGVLGAQRLQEQIDLFGQCCRAGVLQAGQVFLDAFHQEGTGRLGILPGAHILGPLPVRIAGGAAGKG